MPKLTVKKALHKFIIELGIKLHKKLKIYYLWNEEIQPIWSYNKKTLRYEPDDPYFTINYIEKTREWYLGYIYSRDIISHAIIDDITGTCYIKPE